MKGAGSDRSGKESCRGGSCHRIKPRCVDCVFRSYSHKPPKRMAEVLITADETGNLGDRSRGNNYILVATRINDRDGFIDATKHIGSDHELKFSNPGDARFREEVLDHAAPYIEEVVFVNAFKPTYDGWGSKPKVVHDTLLCELRKDLNIDQDESTLVMVDDSSIIAPERVRYIIKGHKNENPNVDCVVLPSTHFFELQTHDFIAGAINQELNRFDSRYVSRLGVNPRGRTVHIR